METEKKIDLIKIANQARKWAYVPYSNYPVGTALLTESGAGFKMEPILKMHPIPYLFVLNVLPSLKR